MIINQFKEDPPIKVLPKTCTLRINYTRELCSVSEGNNWASLTAIAYTELVQNFSVNNGKAN
jgi:hypothetical protein